MQRSHTIQKADLPNYLDKPDNLWGEEYRVQHALITSGFITVPQSLYLVKVDQLKLYKTDDEKRRATFKYNGTDYDLAVTDPKFDEIVREKPAISSILCISLGEEFNGHCYKLVATIF